MKLLKRIFKSKSSIVQIDYTAIDSLLKSADFYNGNIPSSFYLDLLELYTVNSLNKEYPKHQQGYIEFRECIDELSEIYNRIVSTGFEEEFMTTFLVKFKELTSKTFELPGIKSLLALYWYQPIRKTRSDIQKSNNEGLIRLFEEFHTQIRKIIDNIMIVK